MVCDMMLQALLLLQSCVSTHAVSIVTFAVTKCGQNAAEFTLFGTC